MEIIVRRQQERFVSEWYTHLNIIWSIEGFYTSQWYTRIYSTIATRIIWFGWYLPIKLSLYYLYIIQYKHLNLIIDYVLYYLFAWIYFIVIYKLFLMHKNNKANVEVGIYNYINDVKCT